MGCTSSKKEIKQVVEHWMGKEIVFPSNLTMKIYGKDTLDYSLLNHKYKILHYVDTNGVFYTYGLVMNNCKNKSTVCKQILPLSMWYSPSIIILLKSVSN